MRKNKKVLAAILAMLFFGLSISPVATADAEDNNETTVSTGTSISLAPVSKIIQISSNSTYNETFTVNNDGDAILRIEVYAAPYSYVYSNEEGLYKLGFNNENNFTQISRWISFKNTDGNYVEKAFFSIDPKSSLDIAFKITTPESIPNGGQYAVIFAHTLSSATTNGGIRTEASPGMVVYGRSSEGESIVSAEISDVKISDGTGEIVASAKVKNTGNVDFTASGILKVEPIIGFDSYETPAINGRTSIIPDAELLVTDTWADAPWIGIFKATYSVTGGDSTETVERIIFRIPLFLIIIVIAVLTFIIISVIIKIRKRKERRSRFSV